MVNYRKCLEIFHIFDIAGYFELLMFENLMERVDEGMKVYVLMAGKVKKIRQGLVVQK